MAAMGEEARLAPNPPRIQRLFLLSIVVTMLTPLGLHGQAPRQFRAWIFSDANVGSDMKKGRESLATAIRHPEAAPARGHLRFVGQS